MKTNSLVIIAGLCALMGIASAKEDKAKANKKEISPEILEKYDTDKDGKLSKDEKAVMKKDKAAEPKKEKKKKKAKTEEPKTEEPKTEEPKTEKAQGGEAEKN